MSFLRPIYVLWYYILYYIVYFLDFNRFHFGLRSFNFVMSSLAILHQYTLPGPLGAPYPVDGDGEPYVSDGIDGDGLAGAPYSDAATELG